MSSARTSSASTGGHRAMPSGTRSGAARSRAARSGAGRSGVARSRASRGDVSGALVGVPRWVPAAAVIAGPILGALLGQALGGYHGPLFVLLTVAGAALATAAATPDGRWWVIPAVPPVAWLVAAAAELTLHDPPYADTKAKAVGLVHATTHVFPVILAALAVMGLVTVAANLRARATTRATVRATARPRGDRRA